MFGECMKTCDLGAMFANHQPKRRRYDKRTSSANWGDDGSPPPPPPHHHHVAHIVHIFLRPWLNSRDLVGRVMPQRHRELRSDSHFCTFAHAHQQGLLVHGGGSVRAAGQAQHRNAGRQCVNPHLVHRPCTAPLLIKCVCILTPSHILSHDYLCRKTRVLRARGVYVCVKLVRGPQHQILTDPTETSRGQRVGRKACLSSLALQPAPSPLASCQGGGIASVLSVLLRGEHGMCWSGTLESGSVCMYWFYVSVYKLCCILLPVRRGLGFKCTHSVCSKVPITNRSDETAERLDATRMFLHS